MATSLTKQVAETLTWSLVDDIPFRVDHVRGQVPTQKRLTSQVFGFLTVSASEIPNFHKEIPDVPQGDSSVCPAIFWGRKKITPRIFKAIYRPHEFDEKFREEVYPVTQ